MSIFVQKLICGKILSELVKYTKYKILKIYFNATLNISILIKVLNDEKIYLFTLYLFLKKSINLKKMDFRI